MQNAHALDKQLRRFQADSGLTVASNSKTKHTMALHSTTLHAALVRKTTLRSCLSEATASGLLPAAWHQKQRRRFFQRYALLGEATQALGDGFLKLCCSCIVKNSARQPCLLTQNQRGLCVQ